VTEHDERTGTGDDRPWTVAIRDTRLQQYHQLTLCALGLAVMGAIAVFGVATELFPYHSLNHDEGVYLQQAAMLLDGQLVLHPPVEGAFRPWFFVDGGEYLYPKYAPVPAAIFALGLGIGVPRLSLAAIAAAIVFLTHIIASEAFSRRIGLLAAAFMLVSPLFVLNAAVFLPYAPTTALNLAFGAAFLRADRIAERRRSLRYAGLAGAAIGLAFFARPYTAVLFALPFVAYALWTLREGSRDRIETLGVVALFGCCGVVLTLAYNATLTGAPLRFPYEVFAVRDGLGFGTRAMLGYEVTYTPALALRANARVLAAFVTEWIAGGLLGGILALCGLLVFVVRAASRRAVDPRQLTVLGVLLTVSAGNLYFWGNLNILGSLSASGDGLISYLGPYYHFDLLLPVSVLAALGSVWLFDRSRSFLRTRLAPTHAQAALAVVALLLAAGVAGGSFAAGTPHVRANAAVTENYERAYAPVEQRGFDDALVFVPGPYGPWLNHPFQILRNDPGYDGNVVYALEKRPFAVVDAFPDRTLYRYSYRGRWAPVAESTVTPRLRRIETVAGERVSLRATLGVPASAERVSIRVSTGEEQAYYGVRGTPEELPLRIVVADGDVRVRGPVTPVGDGGIPIGTRGTLAINVFVDYGTGTGFSYDLRVPIAQENGTVRALSPAVEVCRMPLRCSGSATYVPGETRPGVGVETALEANATDADTSQRMLRSRSSR
jgi:4-amino-4-deoxy-L-arabinose transferase-like glycosyltransferase